MEHDVKKYTKGSLTVYWKPSLCIHSTRCWRGLSAVFNPSKRPWVDMEGAEATEIMNQISKCPSGALSYQIEEKTEDVSGREIDSIVTVEAMKNGPLLVYGNLHIKDSHGNEVTKNKVTAFCRCGASANKPFCDGSHIRIGFRDE